MRQRNSQGGGARDHLDENLTLTPKAPRPSSHDAVPSRNTKVSLIGTTTIAAGLLLCLIAVGVSWWSRRENQRYNPPLDADLPPELYALIPVHMQTTVYTCGVSSMLSIFQAFGMPDNETALADEFQVIPGWGTNWTSMVRGAVLRGLAAHAQAQASLEHLRMQLHKGGLTVIGYQAWKKMRSMEEGAEESYATAWDDGHYSVVMGYNSTHIFLMDPWQYYGTGHNDTYGTVPNDRLLTMWHFNRRSPFYNLAVTFWAQNGPFLTLTTSQPANVLTTE